MEWPLSESGTALLAAGILIDVLLKGTVIIGGAYAGSRLLRGSSAAVRHAIWSAAFAALLLVPVIPSPFPPLEIDGARLLTPGLQEPASLISEGTGLRSNHADAPDQPMPAASNADALRTPVEATGAVTNAGRAATPRAIPITLPIVLVTCWLAGAALNLLWFAIGLVHASGLRRGSTPVPLSAELQSRLERRFVFRLIRIRYAPRVRTPLSFGAFRAVILLPEEAREWPADRLRVVLEHEIAHIERWDYATHVLSQVVRALYWPNPLVWLAARHLHAEQEHACDDRVLAGGTRSFEYADHLLQIARSAPGLRHPGVVALSQRHMLKDRIRSILNGTIDRRPASRRTALVAVLLIAAVALPVTALRPVDPAAAERARMHEALSSDDAARRADAARFFGAHPDPDALPLLIDAVRDPEPSVRLAAVQALAGHPEPKRLAALEIALTDEDPAVVEAAMRALEPVDTPEVRAALDRLAAGATRSDQPDAIEAGSGDTYLFVEVEKGTLTPPMAVYSDASASGGHFVYVADQAGHDPPESGPGAVTLTFDLDVDGAYVVWGRVRSPNDGDNSFFVSMDGREELIWDVPGPDWMDVARNWTWDPVSSRDPESNRVADPIVFHLDAGAHVLRVRNREDGTRLDAVIVTSDLSYVPTGAAPRTPPREPAYVWIQAEAGQLSDGMRTGDDGLASGGSFVSLPDGDGNDAPDGGRASATYHFSVEHSDRYVAWARVQAPAANDNSFFVSLDGDDEVVWHAPGPDADAVAHAWTWARVRMRDGDDLDDSDASMLQPGSHSIRFRAREDGTMLDALLITNDDTFRPRGAGVVPPARSVFVWREAEDARITEPMRIDSHDGASGGRFILTDDARSRNAPPHDGVATYRLEVPEGGTYLLWGRVHIENQNADSFWIRMNGARWIRWNGIPAADRWHWSELHDSDEGNAPLRFDLEPGSHTLEISYREPSSKLDRLLLTNDATYVPVGTGAASSGGSAAASRVEVIF